MVRRFKAIYTGDALIPQQPCDFPEGSLLDVSVEALMNEPPEVPDNGERARIVDQLIARMRGNPIPPGAPRFSRDQLHERD